jgi:hypothetical protein
LFWFCEPMPLAIYAATEAEAALQESLTLRG